MPGVAARRRRCASASSARIGVRLARRDRGARSGTRRPTRSRPSPSRRTPARRSPRTRRRRRGRGTRTSPAATSRSCRRCAAAARPVRPASARWNACECRFGIAGTTGPAQHARAVRGARPPRPRRWRPSSSTSIATSRAQPSGSSARGATNVHRDARRRASIAATSADRRRRIHADARHRRCWFRVDRPARAPRRHANGAMSRRPGIRTRRPPRSTRTPRAGAIAAARVAHDDDVAARRAAADHQVEVARRAVDERAVDAAVAGEAHGSYGAQVERRAAAPVSRMPLPREQHERAVDAGKRRERAVALDVGDADAPREGVERRARRIRRRFRSCGRRRSSTACGGSRRASSRCMAVRGLTEGRTLRLEGRPASVAGRCILVRRCGVGVDRPIVNQRAAARVDRTMAHAPRFVGLPPYARGASAMRSALAVAVCIAASPAPPSAAAQDTKVAIGISGWTGFAPLTLAKEAGIFKKNGLDVVDQEDPAEGPPPRDRLRRRAVRGDDRRDLDRLERQRRGDDADLPARQELRRRRHGRAQQRREDRRPQGQDRRGVGARHGAVLHARVVPQEERPVGEGRHRRQPRARPGRAGVRRRPERRGDDLRAVPVDGARRIRRPARSSRPRSTTR